MKHINLYTLAFILFFFCINYCSAMYEDEDEDEEKPNYWVSAVSRKEKPNYVPRKEKPNYHLVAPRKDNINLIEEPTVTVKVNNRTSCSFKVCAYNSSKSKYNSFFRDSLSPTSDKTFTYYPTENTRVSMEINGEVDEHHTVIGYDYTSSEYRYRTLELFTHWRYEGENIKEEPTCDSRNVTKNGYILEYLLTKRKEEKNGKNYLLYFDITSNVISFSDIFARAKEIKKRDKEKIKEKDKEIKEEIKEKIIERNKKIIERNKEIKEIKENHKDKDKDKEIKEKIKERNKEIKERNKEIKEKIKERNKEKK